MLQTKLLTSGSCILKLEAVLPQKLKILHMFCMYSASVDKLVTLSSNNLWMKQLNVIKITKQIAWSGRFIFTSSNLGTKTVYSGWHFTCFCSVPPMYMTPSIFFQLFICNHICVCQWLYLQNTINILQYWVSGTQRYHLWWLYFAVLLINWEEVERADTLLILQSASRVPVYAIDGTD